LGWGERYEVSGKKGWGTGEGGKNVGKQEGKRQKVIKSVGGEMEGYGGED